MTDEIQIACPKCKKPFDTKNSIDYLLCDNCLSKYEIKNGIPILFDNLSTFKLEESNFHSEIAYDTDDVHNLKSYRINYLHNKFLKYIFELPPESRILEIACGTGEDLLKLKMYNFVGTDISHGMVLNTKMKLLKLEKNCMNNRLLVADAECLPFMDNYFDAVLIVGALHHLENIEQGINEMVRCLKNEGILVIGSEPTRWPYYFKFIKHSNLGVRFLKLFRDDYSLYKGSVADWNTVGFKRSDFENKIKSSELELIDITPLFFINGFLQLFKINTSENVAKFLIRLDEIILSTPILNNLSWKWNVVMKKVSL